MSMTRREFGQLALASLPASAFLGTLFGSNLFQARPNSLINGVQIGTITYSYRSMPDQSAEATLQYIVASGLSAIELMDGPVDAWARAQTGFTPPNSGRRGGGRWRGTRTWWTGRRRTAGTACARSKRHESLEWSAAFGGTARRWTACPSRRSAAGRRGRGAGAAGAPGGGGARGGGRAELTPNRSRSSRRRPTPFASGASPFRWTSSRSCGRCTTTLASASTR